MRSPTLALLLALGLAGCSAVPGRPQIETLETRAWRQVATDADRKRIADWRGHFVSALDEARRDGNGSRLDALGDLAVPDAALPFSVPPTGEYKCRIIKVGSQGNGTLTYVDYPYFRCRMAPAQDLIQFAKLTGSQRPVGLVFEDSAMRRIFLGTLVLGDEERAMRYGADPDRDIAAILERIGEKRWRMIVPAPRYESRLDIIDLVPVD
ncbi:DUF4893 domain-containing protein [Sphingomicrobium nitratireducens]|uniref:DUF4893 domain-containing protein n=1 Tax=Sphingomicrobium nitratireducens TaxID=2964666 RepID=UPI00224061F0|nr:DUF4893 domain-containing protein [Sphingomicrobium nitratireducens]